MGRKFDLIKQSDKVLGQIRSGSPRTKLKRKREVRQMINDLVRVGIAPPKITGINKTHIESMVSHWKQRQLSTITIMNKLSVARCFLKVALPALDFPSNKDLGVTQKEVKRPTRLTQGELQNTITVQSKLNHYDCIMQSIETKFTQSVIAFQLFFGLTKMESIRLDASYAANEGQLLIDRGLASNGKDRYVPIVTIEQEQAIQARNKLLAGKAKLTDLLSEPDAVALYKAEMLLTGINPKVSLRGYYANTRLSALLQTYQKPEALKKLQNEMGLRSKYVLEQLLW